MAACFAVAPRFSSIVLEDDPRVMPTAAIVKYEDVTQSSG